MAALVRLPSYLYCRSPEDHRAGRGVGDGWWVVGCVAIVVATSFPPPTESTTDALLLPSLPYAGSPEAIRRRHLRLSVSAGHNGDGGGVVGGAVPRGGRGWGVNLGDVWGGGDIRSPLTSPSFPRLL